MKSKIYITCLMLLATAGFALGQTSTNEVSTDDALQAEYQRILSRCGLKIISHSPSDRQVSVVPVNLKDMDSDVLLEFFTAIDVFPASFMQRTHLKTVIFYRKLVIHGVTSGGMVTTGDTLYLPATGVGSANFYSMLYHSVDPQRNNTMWTRLNNPRFTYEGNQGNTANVPKSNVTKSQLERNRTEGYIQDFVNSGAMSHENFDRAETFAVMIANPKKFAKLAEESTVVAKKGEMMQKIAERITIDMNKEFWEYVAENDERNRRQALVERAMTNAKLRQENKPPIQGGFKRTKK